MGNSMPTGHRSKSLRDSKSAAKIHLPLDSALEEFSKDSSTPKQIGLQVKVPTSGGYSDCYLDTTRMSMCYLTPQQPWTHGNVSLNWILRHHDAESYRLSNYVTDVANESPRKGISKTYLDTANQLASGGYALQFVGNGIKLYLERDTSSSTSFALYMKQRDDKYYLQPCDPATGENSIVAKAEEPQDKHIFALVSAQPVPSLAN